jgi:hypothetical protein
MGIIWNGDISKTASLLEISGRRELRWFGVTVGQVGFGVLVSVKRQPTKRALDAACRHTWSTQTNGKWKCIYCGVVEPPRQ